MAYPRRTYKRRRLSYAVGGKKKRTTKRRSGTKRATKRRSYSKGILQWLMSPDTPRARVANSFAELPLPLKKDPPLPVGAIPFTDGSKGYWIPNPIPFGQRKGQYGLTNDQIDTINDLGLAAGGIIGTTIGAWVLPEVLGFAAGAALADVGILASIESAALRVGSSTIARGARWLKNARSGVYNSGTELRELGSSIPRTPDKTFGVGVLEEGEVFPSAFRESNAPNVIRRLREQNYLKRTQPIDPSPQKLKSFSAQHWNNRFI